MVLHPMFLVKTLTSFYEMATFLKAAGEEVLEASDKVKAAIDQRANGLYSRTSPELQVDQNKEQDQSTQFKM